MSEVVWRAELLTRRGDSKGFLPTVRGGKLHWSIFKSVRGSGTLELTEAPGLGIDYLNDRVRVTCRQGESISHWGVWLIAMTGKQRTGPKTDFTLNLADVSETLNNPLGGWVTIPAGLNIVSNVLANIKERADAPVAYTPSTEVARVAATWEPQDTYLKLCNDTLKTIGYASVAADVHGRLAVQPYVPPDKRPLAAAYGAGGGQLRLLEQWDDEADLSELPTGARIYIPGNETAPGMVGRADLADEHPLSAASRGRAIYMTEQGEAASQAAADALAQRRLSETLQVTRRVKIQHPIDGTQLDDVVQVEPAGITGPIVEREVTLSLGAVVTSTVRQIYTGGALPWQ